MPILDWVASLIEIIIIKHFGYTDLKLKWSDSKDPDLAQEADIDLKGAQADQIRVTIGTRTVNELREEDGLEPLSPQELEALKPKPTTPPEGAKTAPEDKQQPDATIKEPAAKLEKKKIIPSHRLTVIGPRY